MAFLAVMVLRPLRRGECWGLWCVLGVLVAMALSDSTYTYLVGRGSYATGNLVDTGWVVAYLPIALGALGSRSQEPRVPVAVPSEVNGRLTLAVTPFVPVLVALGALTVDRLLGRPLDRTGWGVALALSLLAITRQAMGLLGRLEGPNEAVASFGLPCLCAHALDHPGIALGRVRPGHWPASLVRACPCAAGPRPRTPGATSSR